MARAVLPPRGLFYFFELPFLVTGLYHLVKKRFWPGTLLLSWFFLAPIADSLTGPGNVSRMLVFLPSFQIITAFGLHRAYLGLKKINRPVWLRISGAGLILIISLSFFIFIFDYFIYFPAPYCRYSHYGYQQVFTYLNKVKGDYDKVYLSTRHHDTKHYVFYLFFTKYPPAKYQTGEPVSRFEEENGWIKVSRVDNIFFVGSVPKPENLKPNSLVLADPGEILPKIEPVIIFYDLTGDPLFKAVTTESIIEAAPEATKNF